jgi:putative flippase GtrA
MTITPRELLIYAGGSATAFAVDVASLAFFVEVVLLHYLVAATLSFVAGTAVVYWISIAYAFAYRRVEKAHSEFALFALIGIVGICINLVGMYLSVERLHLHYLLGKVIAAGITFFANFGLRRILLFTPWGDHTALRQHRSCD